MAAEGEVNTGASDATSATSAAAEALPLRSLGKYHPLFELGHGGMATVLLAVIRGPAGFSKLQVLKVLRPNLAAEPDFLTMFLHEARLSAQLNHPNVVQTNEVGGENGDYFIAMEYLEGHSFEELLKFAEAGSGIPMPIALNILVNTLAGLHYAHEMTDYQGHALQIVHRDVSPQNVFVTYDGQVKVLDFGIAKAANSNIETRSGVIKGKVAYMAREQLDGASEVDCRADIFAVGAVMWRILAGQRLWRGLGDLEIFRHLLAKEMPTPSAFNADVDPELESICLRALAHEPSERYPSAAALQAALESYIEAKRMRVGPREVGEFVQASFGHRRAKVRSAIEVRLREAGTESATGMPVPHSLPTIVPTMTPSNGTPLTAGDAFSGTGMSTGSHVGPLGGATNLRRAAFGVGLFAVAGVTLFFAMRGHGGQAAQASAVVVASPSDSTMASSPPPDATPQTSGAAVPTTTQVSIKATPRSARLSLDDTPLPSNPWSGTVPRDGATHQLRIEAPGYVTRTQPLVYSAQSLDVDQALDHIVIGRSSGRVSVPDRDTHTPTVTQPAPPPAPGPQKPPKPALDNDDPWKK